MLGMLLRFVLEIKIEIKKIAKCMEVIVAYFCNGRYNDTEYDDFWMSCVIQCREPLQNRYRRG